MASRAPGPANAHVVVVGGVNRDVIARAAAGTRMVRTTSNIGVVSVTWGGVGHNVALCLAQLRARLHFVTVVGADATGRAFSRYANECGIGSAGVIVASGRRSCRYVAVLDESGDLVASVADMDSIEAALTPLALRRHFASSGALASASILAIDGNVPPKSLAWLCAEADRARTAVFFEPTSKAKALRGVAAWSTGLIHFICPNTLELESILGLQGGAAAGASIAHEEGLVRDALRRVPAARLRAGGHFHVILTLGARGVLLGTTSKSETIQMTRLASARVRSVVSTSGAGDTLAGATMWSLLVEGDSDMRACPHARVVHALGCGMRAARMTLASMSSVSPRITPDALRLTPKF